MSFNIFNVISIFAIFYYINNARIEDANSLLSFSGWGPETRIHVLHISCGIS